jgi:hypothetical protein
MLLVPERYMMRIFIIGAVILLTIFVAGCSPTNDETSITESTTISEGPGSSEPTDTPTETLEPTVTSKPIIKATPTSEPTSEPTVTPEPTREPSPTPDIQMYLDLDLPEGNPIIGQTVAIRYLCRTCHFKEEHEPFIGFTAVNGLPPILERGEVRIADPDYTGKATSNLEYFFESIYLPELYIVEGEWVEAMPTTFNYRLTDAQDLADLIAWLEALNDPEFENK